MVPYSFNIKPATVVAEVLIKYGAKVNSELEPSPTIKILIPRGMKKIYIYIFLKNCLPYDGSTVTSKRIITNYST